MPGGTPYLTPGMLTAQPAGISWLVVPTLTASSPQQQAQLAAVCWKATSRVDTFCRQPLRATISTEQGTGPGQPRVSVDRCTGVATLITRRWPVVAVEAVQYALAPPWGTYPPAWQAVPSGRWNIRHPPVLSAGPAPVTGPSGGNVIDVAPGFIGREHGRSGWNVMWSCQTGFGAHTSLTQAANSGDTTLHVDDVTGWAGVTGFAYGGTLTEPVEAVSAAATVPVQLPGVGGTVQAGPGTLTLSAPLESDHYEGTVISALPADVLRAAGLAAAVEALQTMDAIATQSLSGQFSGGTGALIAEYEAILSDFRRVM